MKVTKVFFAVDSLYDATLVFSERTLRHRHRARVVGISVTCRIGVRRGAGVAAKDILYRRYCEDHL